MAAPIAHMASLIEGELRIVYLYDDNSTRTVTKDVVEQTVTQVSTGTARVDDNGNPTEVWWT